VRVILLNKILLEHTSCRSMACMLNAGGAKLWNLANAISAATLAGRFSDALLKDLESICPGNTICHVFPRGDEYTNHQHHPKIFGYPLSRSSCPRETELVVKLLDGLFLQIFERSVCVTFGLRVYEGRPHEEWTYQVRVLCSVTLDIYSWNMSLTSRRTGAQIQISKA
jgi:hypothetical protein